MTLDELIIELQKQQNLVKQKISHKITEYVFKDSPLTYKPNDIYEIIEGDEYDAITYDYKLVYVEDYIKSWFYQHVTFWKAEENEVYKSMNEYERGDFLDG